MSRLLALFLALSAASCGDDRPEGPRSLPRDPDAPWVISAIDYHFHDAHPTDPLAPEREVVVSNQGRNVHNVTLADIGFSRDIQPGERISLGPAGELVPGPGRITLRCTYHLDRGMTGVIVVAG
ncbi:MAG TPA: hypothetical protein VGB28_04370 [Actinomycetota bacterium]